MSNSIVKQLVLKDLQILRIPTFCWWLGGMASVLVAIFGGSALGTASFILFVTCMAGAGVHAAMLSTVEERREQVLAFIMSLPISVREYTSAKLIANMICFGIVWLTLSAASFVVFLGDEGLPDGTRPLLVIILLGILLAYTIILATGLIFEALGPTIVATVAANIGTQIYIWIIAELQGIRAYIGSDEAVWNSTVVSVLAIQAAVIVALLAGTYFLQARKTDFL